MTLPRVWSGARSRWTRRKRRVPARRGAARERHPKAKRAPADSWDPAKNAWARSPRGLAEAAEGRTLFRTARAPGPFVQPCDSQPQRPTGFAPREPHRRRSLSPPFASAARSFGAARLVQPAPFVLSSRPIPRHRHPLLRRQDAHTYTVADRHAAARGMRLVSSKREKFDVSLPSRSLDHWKLYFQHSPQSDFEENAVRFRS